jgi:hypothetical protein
MNQIRRDAIELRTPQNTVKMSERRLVPGSNISLLSIFVVVGDDKKFILRLLSNIEHIFTYCWLF